jgi:hypothetical protein
LKQKQRSKSTVGNKHRHNVPNYKKMSVGPMNRASLNNDFDFQYHTVNMRGMA